MSMLLTTIQAIVRMTGSIALYSRATTRDQENAGPRVGDNSTADTDCSGFF